MRQIVERHNIVRNKTLNLGGRTTIKDEFPLGEGIHSLHLQFSFVVTVGTATGPVIDGLYKAIRNIYLRTDHGEVLCNVPGKFFWFQNLVRFGTPPRSTALAAASATYVACLVIPFTDHRTMNPNDTILNMARYQSMQMELNMGTIADLFTAVGSGAVTLSLTMDVMKTRGLLPNNELALPSFHIAYDTFAPVDAATTTRIDLDTVPDLSYKRLYIGSTTTGVAGQPFYGTFADTVIDRFSLKDQSSDIIRDVDWNMLQADNALRYGWDVGTTPLTPNYPVIYPTGFLGLGVISFVGEGESLKSALFSGDKQNLQLSWTNETAPANSFITLGYEAIRLLK